LSWGRRDWYREREKEQEWLSRASEHGSRLVSKLAAAAAAPTKWMVDLYIERLMRSMPSFDSCSRYFFSEGGPEFKILMRTWDSDHLFSMIADVVELMVKDGMVIYWEEMAYLGCDTLVSDDCREMPGTTWGSMLTLSRSYHILSWRSRDDQIWALSHLASTRNARKNLFLARERKMIFLLFLLLPNIQAAAALERSGDAQRHITCRYTECQCRRRSAASSSAGI
jgi:hypothetical protein